MKFRFILVLLLLLSISFLQAQQIKVVDFNELKPLLEKQNDTTYVINFWATWCIPCVKELPDFIKLNGEMKNQKFKMLLVSLDFKSQINKVLIPYIKKNNVDAEVIVLSDPNANEWINKVNTKWSGALPASIIYNKNYYYFREGSFTYDELKVFVSKNIIK